MNVKCRPGLTRSFRSSPDVPFELSLELSVALYVEQPTWSIYCSWCPYKARYARSLELYDVMRSRVAVIAFRRMCRWIYRVQQCLIKYEISFTGGKALTEASKSIRSWQINAAEISHSVGTYGITYLTAECACPVSRCIVDSIRLRIHWAGKSCIHASIGVSVYDIVELSIKAALNSPFRV